MNTLRRLCQGILLYRYPLVPILLGTALALPSLSGGLRMDDYSIRAAVLGSDDLISISRSPWDPFNFLDGDPESHFALVDSGIIPWWSDPECRLAFFRPGTALTHIVDFHLWGDWPWLMHVHSIAWYALLIWMACIFYRRMFRDHETTWIWVLAGVLFAVDEAHGVAVGWLANRNSLVAGVFGIAALIVYDRWRRDGWRPGAVLAPVALGVALLSKEAAICVTAYLLAYAVFLDRGRWLRRLASLLPCACVTVAWYTMYKLLGYGAFASGAYIDPGHDPVAFLGAVIERAPFLLMGQWSMLGAEVSLVASPEARQVFWWVAVAMIGIVAVLVGPLVARSRLARFWTAGMLLSVSPACVVFPGNRLLLFVGLGGLALLAQFLAGIVENAAENASWMPRARNWRRLARCAAYFFIVVHLVLSPLSFPVAVNSMATLGKIPRELADSLPDDPELAGQRVVLVNSWSWMGDTAMLQMRQVEGGALPGSLLNLCPATYPATLHRTDARSLIVRPGGGFFPPPNVAKSAAPRPAFAVEYVLRTLDILTRSPSRPMQLGETVQLSGVTIEITALCADGRPAEATFRFDVPLEDPSLRWLRRTDGEFVPFTPPAVGQTVNVGP